MNLSDDVDLEDYVSRPDKLSGAEIHCIVQEAGMHAVRKNRYLQEVWYLHSFCKFAANRYVVIPKDFEKGYKNNTKKQEADFEFYR